jgi:hypothetical protein
MLRSMLPGAGAGMACADEKEEAENGTAITRKRARRTASDFPMQKPTP